MTVTIESLDVFKTQMDLQEHERLATTYLKINQIIENISDLDVFPSLVWVWTWDMVKDRIHYYSEDAGEEYTVNPKLTEEDVWWMFVRDCDTNDFSLDYGAEALDEHIFKWMVDRDILVWSEVEEDEGE